MDTEGVLRIPCFAHVIALAVNRANKNVAPIKKWKSNVVKITGHFHHSIAHLALLKQEQ